MDAPRTFLCNAKGDFLAWRLCTSCHEHTKGHTWNAINNKSARLLPLHASKWLSLYVSSFWTSSTTCLAIYTKAPHFV
jgi:hypothetical protein